MLISIFLKYRVLLTVPSENNEMVMGNFEHQSFGTPAKWIIHCIFPESADFQVKFFFELVEWKIHSSKKFWCFALSIIWQFLVFPQSGFYGTNVLSWFFSEAQDKVHKFGATESRRISSCFFHPSVTNNINGVQSFAAQFIPFLDTS